MSNSSSFSCLLHSLRPDRLSRAAIRNPIALLVGLTAHERSPNQWRRHFITFSKMQDLFIRRNTLQNGYRWIHAFPTRYNASATDNDKEDPEKAEALYNIEEMLESIKKQKHTVIQPDPKKKKVARTYRESPMTIEEVVQFLHKENARDVCVVQCRNKDYMDYLVVCTGIVARHIASMADSLAAAHKHLYTHDEQSVKVEGEDCDDWMAVDIGRIVVHFMTSEARNRYQLEQLWALGPEYDAQTIQHQRDMEFYDVNSQYKE